MVDGIRHTVYGIRYTGGRPIRGHLRLPCGLATLRSQRSVTLRSCGWMRYLRSTKLRYSLSPVSNLLYVLRVPAIPANSLKTP